MKHSNNGNSVLWSTLLNTCLRLFLGGMCFLLFTTWALADIVQVAVASNFIAPMRHIVIQFEAASGHTLALSTGSSGKLYAQVRNGAPFAVLLSADASIPEKLVQEGLAVTNSPFTYAFGRLVLWSARTTVVDAQGLILRQKYPAQALKLALANPKLAPYGAAALQVLQNLKVQAQWSKHLVLGENVAQAYQFVASENALLGFVALSQIQHKGHLIHGSAWVVPADLYHPIEQDAVLLTAGQKQPAAQAFMVFLRSAQAQKTIQSFGYFTESPNAIPRPHGRDVFLPPLDQPQIPQ